MLHTIILWVLGTFLFVIAVIAVVILWDLVHQEESEAENHEHSIGSKDKDHD